MPYITSAERIGIEKGILQGMEKGIVQGIEKGMLQGMEKGMISEAREMVLEALDTKFSSNIPTDVHELIKALNNKILLKKLLRSAIQSRDIDGFRKSIQEITRES